MFEKLVQLTESHRVVCVEGPNGSGKSTLLDAYQNLLFSQKTRFGVLSQHDDLDLRLTPRHLLELTASARAFENLDRLHFSGGLLDATFSILSSGERTKVLVSAALASGELSVLDEPFAHLDQVAKLALEQLILESPQPIVLANHEPGVLPKAIRLVLPARF